MIQRRVRLPPTARATAYSSGDSSTDSSTDGQVEPLWEADPEADPLSVLLGLGLELPAQGTGARAARRGAASGDVDGTTTDEMSETQQGGTETSNGAPAATEVVDERQGDEATDRQADADAPSPESGETRSAWRRWRPVAYTLSLALLIGAGAILSVIGYRVLRSSTEGRTVDPTLGPDEPGFEAFVEPSPTMLVLTRSADGSLSSAALLALRTEDSGTSVVVIPTTMLVGEPGAENTLAQVVQDGGGAAALAAVANRLGIGIAEVVELDDAQLAALVAPVAPLTVRNSDEATGFPVGDIQLTAEEVGPFLSVLGDGERETDRMLRQERVWNAWASSLALAGPAGVPGEVETGIGRFLAGLAENARQAESLPVTEQPSVAGTSYVVDQAALAPLLADAVPFPTAAEPGDRLRVRLLDGTGDPTLTARVAPQLVAAGAEIVLIGNATDLNQQTSEVIYHDARFEDVSDFMLYGLGTGSKREEVRPTDLYDVTIVLGADVASTISSPSSTSSTDGSDTG